MLFRSILGSVIVIILAGCAGSGGAPVSAPASGTAASGVPGAADVLTYRGNSARTGQMPGPGPTGNPQIRWAFRASAPIGSQVAVMGQMTYLVSTDGQVHALDLATGTPRWSASTGAEAHGSPTIADGLLIVGGDDGARAFGLADGRLAWSATQTGTVRGAPATVGHVAVFAGSDGNITALDSRSGTVLWQRSLGSPDDSSVAAADGVAILGLENGTVVALALADGHERWRTDTGDGARIGTPTVADGRVFVATLDGINPGTRQIMALDLETGQIQWRFASPGDKPAYAPAIADGRAIVEGEDGSVTALDPGTGKVIWQAPAPGLVEVVAAATGGVVYGASNGGFAFALDASSGLERWRVPIKGVPYGVAVVSGLVLVGTNLGTLDAIGGVAP